MTLGADFMPAVGRAAFLGMWRLVSDVGTAGGPLLISAAGAVASLSAGAWAVGGIGIAGAALLASFAEPVGRRAGGPSTRARRRLRRRNAEPTRQ